MLAKQARLSSCGIDVPAAKQLSSEQAAPPRTQRKGKTNEKRE